LELNLKNIKIFLKGVDRTAEIARFERCGSIIKIKFKNGKTYPYNIRNVRFEGINKEDKLIEERFSYFKELAKNVGLEGEIVKGQKINILLNNYSKIDSISDKTILYNYLKGEMPEREIIQKPKKRIFGPFFRLIEDSIEDEKENIIYPFGFNISQKSAVEKALNNRISIIEGPPGTGKTQTILNIIANAIMNNESVAVVSSNNAATKNIIDKLKKYDVDFIAAYLGNNENKQEFIKSQKNLPDMEQWQIKPEIQDEIRLSLKNENKILHQKLQEQILLSRLKQELSEIEIENKHHLLYLKTFGIQYTPDEIKKIKTCARALELGFLFDIEENKKDFWLIGFLKSVIEFFGIKVFTKTLIQRLLKKYPKSYLVAACEQKFYEIKIAELKETIEELENSLNEYDFKAKMLKYSKLSLRLLKAKLARKYRNKKRTNYALQDLQTKSREFIKDYPVILSTTYSLRNSLNKDVAYDYVIVDEASQVDLCTGVLALSCAKKAVIVGDLKQLPNVVSSKNAALSDLVFKKYNLPEVYRYKKHCLLSSISKMFPYVQNTLLKEHYRCHPLIIEFCNKKFYNGELIILTDFETSKKPLIVYKTRKGNHSRDNVNQRQIDVIKNEIIPNENLDIDDDSLGIVTPYRNQTNELQRTFKETDIKIDTVDKFQGRENRVIILSTVDNEIRKFTDNPNRLNVAISRAIEQLIVVVNDESYSDTNIGELVKYIEYSNCEIINSKVYSVFDYLYKGYFKERIKLLRKYKRVSQIDSENLMYTVICDVLQEYNNFDVAVHVPLNIIIKDTSFMDDSERKYILNDWSHTDFLIYNKIDKSPVAAIEVDGYAFHKDGTKQSFRDKMKDDIFEKYGIKLLRFKTTGSSEKERLIAALKGIL